MRLYISLITALAMMLVAGTASATITATIANVTVVGAGAVVDGFGNVDVTAGSTATIEFDIFLTKDDSGNVGALGISVFGYDVGAVGSTGDLISYTSGSAGTASSDIFLTANLTAGYSPNPIGSPTGPNEFNGVPNLQLVPAEISIAAAPFELNVVNVFNTAVLGGTGGGGIDGGVDGLVGGPQVHVLFTLTGISTGAHELSVGLGNGDGYTNVAGDTVELVGDSIFIIPEPGTALLMALGLAGISAAGRGRKE